MASDAAEQLRRSAEAAWNHRWLFVKDANGDGAISLEDVPQWFAWLFFAPGDWAILTLIKHRPETALFLEITPQMQSGLFSGLLSLGVWLVIGAFVGAIIRKA